MNPSSENERRLRSAFEQHSLRVFAYARRHVDDAMAQDVVSDVFLVAWRRISEMPEPPLPWLLVVARNTLANDYRSTVRRARLQRKLAGIERLARVAPAAEDSALERRLMLTALTALTEAEREAVLLIAWDGLTPEQAAKVAGCSARAMEVRLSRARARLHRLLIEPATPFPAREVVA